MKGFSVLAGYLAKMWLEGERVPLHFLSGERCTLSYQETSFSWFVCEMWLGGGQGTHPPIFS